ncbi:MAG: hypothetical protein WC325_12505 [Candidatus Bathyarchaeia archaeon]|jgi:hypothetical protein
MQKPVFTVLFVFLIGIILVSLSVPQVQAASVKNLVFSSISTQTVGVAFTATVTAQKQNGQTETGYTGTVHFTSSDLQAVLPADYTYTAGDKGVHTFSFNLKTAGSQTITVTDLTGLSGSTCVTVNKASTAITVSCSPLTVDKTGTETTTISGYLTSGNTGIASKTITISYNSGTSITIGTCATDANGHYQFQWDVPASVANGYYVVQAAFAGDSNYLGSSAQTSGGGNLFVVPEFPFGGLAALAACIGAFALFNKRRSFSN